MKKPERESLSSLLQLEAQAALLLRTSRSRSDHEYVVERIDNAAEVCLPIGDGGKPDIESLDYSTERYHA